MRRATFPLSYTEWKCPNLEPPSGFRWNVLDAAVCLLGFFFVLARVPVTKGKTLEEIEHEMAGATA